MRLILAEPGLEHANGHYFAHARAIAAECSRIGVPFEVLTATTADEQILSALPARRAFRVALHAQPRLRHPAYALAASLAWGRQYRRDFYEALGGRVEAGDLLLLNTVTISLLDGLAGWLARSTASARPATAVMLRFGAEEGLPRRVLPSLSRSLYRGVLDRLHRRLGARLLLATDTRLIGGDFEQLIGRPVAAIPLPLAVPPAQPPRCGELLPHLVFLGGAMPEKGFHLLPDALEATLRRFPDARATVQIARPRKSYAPLVARLKAMAPAVRTLDGAIDDTEFYRLLSDADVVLLPYDPVVFAKRSSQILAESASLGRPVIVVAGSFLDREMHETGIVGVTAQSFSAEALSDAMARFIGDRSRLTAAAWQECSVQRRRHDVAAFVDALVSFASTAKPAR